jgi:hypothetical protein
MANKEKAVVGVSAPTRPKGNHSAGLIAQGAPSAQDGLRQRFGAWSVIRADATGRRILVACKCSTVREVSREALESGESVGCGCGSTPRLKVEPARGEQPSYAAARWRER